jgi:two-component system sensor histidine kinase ChvG
MNAETNISASRPAAGSMRSRGASADTWRKRELPFSRTRFSSLTRRIIFFNAFALLVFVAGVLWVQSNRAGLVDERIAGIRDQALIVASALSEYAANGEGRGMDSATAEPLLKQLIAPTRLRAQVFSTRGMLVVDTRYLLGRNLITREELPPPRSANRAVALFQRGLASVEHVYDELVGVRPLARLEPYFEAGRDGRIYHEVVSALNGRTGSAVRVNEQGKLVISVAVPIQRLATLYGVLLLTTESGDIDDILKEERSALIKVSLIAFGALLLSSLYLAGFIAVPIRRLAAAAERVRRGRGGREQIPTFGERGDEIGELADSLSGMTRALYDRIDAIEKFAADVAHELKNPLTSLKSAVDMLERTPEPEARERLASVIRNDIKRIDRLISEISDASRLDAELSRATSESVDIGRLMETLVGIYSQMHLPRNVTLSLQREGSKPAVVQGLDERLGQVFRNLIDNAISFSPEGGTVLVNLSTAGPFLTLTIEDEGPGIPTNDLEHVFDRFFTARPPEHGFGKNSGLGLAIARQIIMSHGGRIWADNKRNSEGKKNGARFVVELPLARQST